MNRYDFITMILLIVMGVSIVVLGEQEYKFVINGKDVKCNVIVRDGVTYAPLTTISNELGLQLQIDEDTIRLNALVLCIPQRYIGEVIKKDKKALLDLEQVN